MSIFVPKGNFVNDVVDPDGVSEEWDRAKQVADNATNWQFCSQAAGRIRSQDVASNGETVAIIQKHAGGLIGAGHWSYPHQDGRLLKHENRTTDSSSWLIPYLKGWSDLFDGELKLTWTAKHAELVMIGFSFWWYRLSSETAGADDFYFEENVSPRIKTGISVDGTIIEGTGPGCNVPVSKRGVAFSNGSREKSVRSVSNTVQLLPAGIHTISPVAAQGPAAYIDDKSLFEVETLGYFSHGQSATSTGPSAGVAIAQANIHVIRFPRGRMLG